MGESSPPPQPLALTRAAATRQEDAASVCDVHAVEPGAWFISGERIEKAAAMTNWDYYEAQARFQRVMHALGVSDELKAQGAANGDLVMVGDVDFRYYEETAMAARARLAGFVDEDDVESVDDELTAAEAAARRRQRELDEELERMLEEDGEVTRF